MTYEEIYNILDTYEEETRKGWYSYTFVNRSVEIARRSDPNKSWLVCLNKNIYEMYLTPFEENPEKFFWANVDGLSFDYEADDYYITNGIFHPYIAMLHVKDAKKVFEQLKNTIDRYDYILYCKKRGYPLSESYETLIGGINKDISDCAWAGIGSNENYAAGFY